MLTLDVWAIDTLHAMLNGLSDFCGNVLQKHAPPPGPTDALSPARRPARAPMRRSLSSAPR